MISSRLRLIMPLALTDRDRLAQVVASQATPNSDVADLPIELVAQITGPEPGINDTLAQWGVQGTDLGSSFMVGDEMAIVFGDTFAENNSNWRSNVLAFTTDDDPTDGITIDRMITDASGQAKEILPSRKVDYIEMTVIPTYGIAIGDRMILHYMSVEHWGDPGKWDLGHSGFAWSDDRGQNWIYDDAAKWPGDSNFGQVAMEQHEEHIYIWGIPGGRYGGVRLARVLAADLLTLSAWEYWTSAGWVNEIDAAEEVIPPNVGELSVRWNSHYQQWIMMYLNDPMGLIELRTADDITGPWSSPRIAARALDFPALYAPFMFPKWNDGPDIYFHMSMFGPYQVFLLKTRLV
ncbi:MAG: DUF4185 domain-containing protein [Thermomicrobiales bacterium]|nr:DUF4185 domain-containing protein [Thermomicrobiales bacterium]